ncbi:MAG: PAS domain S-box protein [Ferruginibacter sp.]
MKNNDETSKKESFTDPAYLPGAEYFLNANQAVIITDLEAVITFWNKAAAAIYGWTAEEAIGTKIIELVPTQQTKEQAIEIMNLLLQGQSWSGEFIVQRKNGECFPAFVTDLPHYNDDRKLSGIIGISTDLTAQKKAEREISLLLNNTEESFILLDPQLNIVSFNKQASHLYKKHMGASLAAGLPILQFAHPSRVEALKNDYAKILNGNAHESELIFTNSEGMENIFGLKYTPAKDETNKIIGIFISVREITQQKKAEAALIANEAKWHSLVENIHDVFMILNKDAEVKYVSPTIKKFLKYEDTEVMHQNLVDLFHPDDKELIKKILLHSLDHPGTPLICERARIKNKDGEMIWVESNVTNLLDKKEIEGIVFTSWNVSDLVKGEANLKAEQANKVALINATDDLIWSINREYKLVAANAAFVERLKQSAGIDIQPGESLLQEEKVTREYLTFWRALYNRAFTGVSFREEFTSHNTTNDNERSWVEVSFNPILQNNEVTGIACLSRDITDRKKQAEKEKELAINQSLFSSIINNTDDAIISKNLEGIITSWNKGAEKMFGYTAEEAIGKSITILIPTELIQEEAFIINKIRNNEPVEHYETERVDKFGNRKTVSLTVSPILDSEGNVVGASKITRDISRQRKDAIALQQNEARLQGIINSQTNYVIRTDLQGNYTYYNDTFFRDFGWLNHQQDLIGSSGMESIMPYHHEAVRDTVAKCLAEPNKVFQVELDKPISDGTIKTTLWDFICLADFNGSPTEIQCVGIDINQRVSAEKKLKQSLEERNAILESIGDTFFAVDKNWTTTYWNKNAEIMLGIARKKVIGKNIWDIFTGELYDKNYAFSKIALEKNEIQQYEFFYSVNNGWYEVSIFPAENGLSVYFKDITDRKISSELIIEANETYNLVSRATNDVIWDWNVVTGAVKRSAENMKSVFGYDQSVDTDNNDFWNANIHPEDVERVKERFEILFNNIDESYMNNEYRFKKADGTYAYVYDKGYVIRDASGKPQRLIGAVKDITRLKENEFLLEIKAKELAVSNKELEQFAFVASHDLQEPLRMVTSFLTQLKKNYADVLDERANNYINFAVDGATRMRQIILDLLEYSREGRMKQQVEKVDMKEVVEEVMLLAQKKIEELGAVILFNNLPVINTCRPPMLRLLQNLIMNALKFARPGEPPQIEIALVEEPAQWLFTVKDNGIGIEKEYFDKIFILFQKLHNREEYAGNGIGLSVAKKIVETMGGTIWVESTEGNGSTFFFTIKKI